MISRFFKDSKRIRIIALILSFVWMFIIFSFSGQGAEESGAVSRSVSYRMVEASASFLHLDWAGEKIQAVADSIENGVRKAAHMTEYAILAFLAGIALDAWDWWESKENVGKLKAIFRKVLDVAICTVYAATDEWHQTFVPGRHGCVKDVFIDAAGAVIAILLLAWITYLVRKRKG